MANGVFRKILGAGNIGAGITAAAAAASNAMGPIPDGAMNAAERASFIAQWHPTDPVKAAIVGEGLGLITGAVLRHREVKASRAEHMQDGARKARR